MSATQSRFERTFRFEPPLLASTRAPWRASGTVRSLPTAACSRRRCSPQGRPSWGRRPRRHALDSAPPIFSAPQIRPTFGSAPFTSAEQAACGGWTTLRTRHLAEGHVEEQGEIWSAAGELLAESTQIALLLPLPVRRGA